MTPVFRALRRVPAGALTALLLAAAPAAAAGPADELVDRVLAAYGGRAALASVAAYRMEGSVESFMQGTGALVRTFSRPDRLATRLEYPSRREVRLLDRGRGWRSDGAGALAPVEGFLLGSMVLQAARADLPWLLDERRSAVKPLGPSEGGRFLGLHVPLGGGLALTALIEAATGRIVRTEGTLDMPGMATSFVAEYSDFRAVGGVLFPFREANFASGQATGQTTITKVVVNPPLADADFRP